MKSVFLIYEMEPIGFDGKLEAVTRRHYCSIDCRDQGNHFDGPVTFETVRLDDAGIADGAVCDYCGKELG